MKQHVDTAVLFYDADCPLCNHAVAFILRRERHPDLQFAALDSPEADCLLTPDAIPRDQLVLLEEQRFYRGAEAVLRVCRRLHFPSRLLTMFRIVPRPLQRMAYQLVARMRYSLTRRRTSPATSRSKPT